jgi:transposase
MEVRKARAFRADQELPPSALLITSPYDIDARYSRKKSTTWTGYKVHFTETCEANAPHLIVDVITTEATTPDGEIMGELHEQLAQQGMLPEQHLVDMGYVDADVLAESQSRYQVDVLGPVMPDLSWQTREGSGFDHRQFTIDWQAQRVTCPTGQTSQSWGTIRDRHGNPVVRVRFPQVVCQACPFHEQCTHSPARVLILQPTEQAYRALQQARDREQTPEFRAVYARRAGVEGTIAQAVRTCEMRRARYIGSKKLRLQALLTATAMNVLRACAWLAEERPASMPTSRFGKLVASAQQAPAS